MVRANGHNFHEIVRRPVAESERQAIYGEYTAPNTFTLADGELLDCTWAQGAITMANMQVGGAEGCNAQIVRTSFQRASLASGQ